MARLLACLLLLATLAGCVAPAPGTSGVAFLSQGAQEEAAFADRCPPGGSDDRGVCVGHVVSPTDALAEPFVARHPTRPEVVAVGVNAFHSDRALTTGEGPTRVRAAQLDVYVTEDGGATWRRSRLPTLPALPGAVLPPVVGSVGAFHVTGDPALVFEPGGRLHVSGIAMLGVNRGYDVFHARSDDLGRTWSEPTLLTTKPYMDRNWMALAPDGSVYVSWSDVFDHHAHVARTTDGGETWQQKRIERCSTASQVVFAPDPLLSCVLAPTPTRRTGVAVHRIDLDANATQQVSFLPFRNARFPHLYPLDATRWALTLEDGADEPSTLLATSRDGGATWTTPTRLADLLGLEGASFRALWGERGPGGAFHVVVGENGRAPARLLHAAFDPDATRVLSTLPLPWLPGPSTPPTAGPPHVGGDDFYGLAFAGEEGFLAWTQGRVIAFTYLEKTTG